MHKYGLSDTGQRQVLSQFRESGYGYADYAGGHVVSHLGSFSSVYAGYSSK